VPSKNIGLQLFFEILGDVPQKVSKIFDAQKMPFLTPKGPRPFFCEKTLKTAISIAKSIKIWKLFCLHI